MSLEEFDSDRKSDVEGSQGRESKEEGDAIWETYSHSVVLQRAMFCADHQIKGKLV